MAGAAAGAEGDLTAAASEGDLDAVRASLAAGVDANATQRDGSSALLWAAYHGDLEMTQALLEAGADPNLANRFGVTPLLQASRTGQTPLIAALLDGGADVAKTHPEGETALMGAARAGKLDAVQLLLARGANPNAQESFQQQTALMWAADQGHTEVVGALLEAGANPDLKARVSELTERSINADFPSGGFTALMWAARNGHEPVVRRLAAAKADLNLTNGDNATAMIIAIVNDRFDLAATLLELGADANDGSLFHAVEMHDATTDWFAKDGSKLRADHPNKLSSLDLIDRLLAAGADPNKPFVGQLHSASMCCDTRANGTPLFRAATAADVEALKRLLAHGGDPNATPPRPEGRGGPGGGPGPPGGGGRTPILAAMNGGKGVGRAGGPGDLRQGAPPFREASNRKPADAVRVLLAAGADPNAAGPDGSTPLHQAARAGKIDVVRALADGGAKLDARDRQGRTALDLAGVPRVERPFDPNFPSARDTDVAPPEEVVALLRELMQAQGLPITATVAPPAAPRGGPRGGGAPRGAAAPAE